MKRMSLFVAAVLAALVSSAHAQLKIVTTTTDYADIARQIGGDKVSVHSVMQGPENIHNVMAKPTEMMALNKADLFVHGGLDSEPWRDNLLKGARNPRVLPNRPGNVDMSAGIELREIPAGKVDRAQGDVHAFGNPHFSPHPQNAQRMAATLLKAMMAADPANADHYKANAVKFIQDLGETHKRLLKEIKPYSGLKVVTYHAAWDYFAEAFDLHIVGTIEPKPSITPSPAELRKTIELMKSQNVKVVIVETYNSYKEAKSVADAAGAQLVVLPDHVHGLPEAATYQKLFEHNVRKLVEAARAAGVPPKDEPAGRSAATHAQ